MNEKIVFSTRFKSSLTRYSLNFSDDFYESMLLKFENLKIFPRMYPKVENLDYRKIYVKNYIILYTVKQKYINVWDIFPKNSNYYNKLKLYIN